MANIRPPSQIATQQQIISYLYQLSEELNREITSSGGGTDEASVAAIASLSREINRQVEVLRALVKRTAETVTDGYRAADAAVSADLGTQIRAADARLDALGTRVETREARIGSFALRTAAGGGLEIILDR